jgi:cytochrome P450
MEHFNDMLTRPIRLPDWVPTSGNRHYREAVARVEGIIFDLIAEHRGRSGGQGDLLARLLRARDEEGGAMTDRQLRDEALTLYLAGQETTAIALAFCWYLLARNPDQEAKLVAELGATLGGRSPTPADLPHLPYTDGVLREALRLYPPVWAITREPVADDHIGGYVIRRGTLVFLPQWIVHRDPRFFVEPERFEPERWQGDLERRLPRFAYFPFGGGPRICIGREFAMLEARLVLATLVQRFHLDLVPDHPVEPLPAMTLRPKAGIKVIVRRR